MSIFQPKLGVSLTEIDFKSGINETSLSHRAAPVALPGRRFACAIGPRAVEPPEGGQTTEGGMEAPLGPARQDVVDGAAV
jgi:hypothetical protein